MDDAERSMLLDVRRGHVTAAEAIERRLGIPSRETKLRQAVVDALNGALALPDTRLREELARITTDFSRALSR